MAILTRVSNGGADFLGPVTNWSLSADDGRYLLFNLGQFADAPFRYDMQTGGFMPSAAVVNPGHSVAGGYDLSGDGQYASSAQIFRLGFVYLQDLNDNYRTVLSAGTGSRPGVPNVSVVSVAQDSINIAYIERYTVGMDIWVFGPSVRVRVPNVWGEFGTASLTGNSLSGAAERVTFSTNAGTVYYADVAGGATGFTQAPIAIAPGSNASISANGRFVVFQTAAALVLEDTNNSNDIYSHDTLTNTTVLVSKNALGVVGNSNSIVGATSADGRYVVFQSAASNLVANDTNNVVDVFRKDLLTGEVVRVSVANDGTESNGASTRAEISADGQVVTFQSEASNLVSEDGNGQQDVFRVALNGVRTVSGTDVTTSESYQLQAGELTLTLAGTAPSFGYGNGLNNAIVGDGFANTLRGLAGNDALFGNLGADVLLGGVGDDRLDGGGGNDYLVGETGADVILGGADNDLMEGGEGGDYLAGEAGNDILFGGAGANQLEGGIGNDYLVGGIDNDVLLGGDGVDQLEGGAGNDYLVGGTGDDVLVGGEGFDQVEGGDGNDYIDVGNGDEAVLGGNGNDYLIGGGGGDYIIGGAGADVLNGGTGADAFYFANPSEGQDTVNDFSRAEGDHILLSSSGFGMSSLSEGFNFFVGSAPAPTSATPTLLYNTVSGILFYDADGSGAGAAVGIVSLVGMPALQTSDILLV